MNRKEFLQTAGQLSLIPVVIGGQPIRAFGKTLSNTANTFTETDHVLVLIELNGGNDGLNTVIPLDQYSNLFKARENVLIDENKVLNLEGTEKTGLHPSMTKLQEMHKNGELQILQGVGYPNQNRSHFRSKDIWVTGSDSDENLNSGWIGRYLANEWPNYPEGFPNGNMKDPLAIQIGSVVSPVCQGISVNMGLAVSNPDYFYELLTDDDSTPNTRSGRELKFIRTVAHQSNEYAKVVNEASEKGSNKSELYDETESLAKQLKIVARLISGGLRTRVYTVTLGGFDTHANQIDASTGNEEGAHANLLNRVSEAIYAFQDDLKLLGLEDRVLGMTYSEFGRRIKSNASSGTDHGSAAPLFMFGKNVKGGILGENPQIADEVETGDGVEMEIDFRNIYSSVLKNWFCLPSSEVDSVMFQNFDSLDILEDTCQTGSVARALQKKSGDTWIYNYPNPFVESTTVKYASNGRHVRISVLDTQAREISVLVDEDKSEGEHTTILNASSMTPGIYYLQYQSEDVMQSRSVVKIR